jgi:esterase
MTAPSEPNRVALSHRDFGGSGEPPIVILHGMLGSSRNWQTAARDLAVHRRLFALDLRNHGNSPHDPDMSYDAMAADVIHWLDAQGIARAILLGHSMGGKVAMLLACREPARVARLIVVDIAPKNYSWPAHRLEFAAMNELNLNDLKSRAEAEMRLESRVPTLSMRKFLATNLERSPNGGWFWQINLPGITASLSILEGNPLQPNDRFTGPTLFITGGKSQYVLASDHDLIRSHFPSAQIETLAQSAHNPHIEARAEFVQKVEFWAGA